jgi:hypothetical protein
MVVRFSLRRVASCRQLPTGLWGRVSVKGWKAARDEVDLKRQRQIHPRHFDSIIHFCRSALGCYYWQRETSEKEDIGKIEIYCARK